VTDDHPLQECAVLSAAGSSAGGVPASLFNVAGVADWCPGALLVVRRLGPLGDSTGISRC